MRGMIVGFIMLVAAVAAADPGLAAAAASVPMAVSEETQACIGCHATQTSGIYQQWGSSRHFRANVGCFECHGTTADAPDAFDHNGFQISIIVSPADCARCHARQVAEFEESHHAKAGLILGSLDNFLADIVEGDWSFHGESALTVSGCQQCHGAEVAVGDDGHLDPTGWPNTGMGRLNPDGSIGACTACHQRHAFSAAQARRPENCGKCHLGPDHPQKEIYEESKHGIAYRAHADELALDSPKWVLGEDYTAAPTCATCHMSAARTADGDMVPATHDVGLRISWNNRPPVSVRPEVADAKLGLAKMAEVDWKERRANMQQVCGVCHTPGLVDNFYAQYDAVVELYDSKFGAPGSKLFAILGGGQLITPTSFDERVEWTWSEIWHHEGRRARHGASMMAPDYTHWHGLYEVAKHFYIDFIPQLRSIAAAHMGSDDAAKAAAATKLQEAVESLVQRPEHSWFVGELPAAEAERRSRARKEFEKRYQ